MENTISLTVTPLQIFLTLAFQIWLVVFPIIIIRKLNTLTDLLTEYFHQEKESS